MYLCLASQAGDRVKFRLVMTGKIHQSAGGVTNGGGKGNVNIIDINNPLIHNPASEGDYSDNADHDFNVNTIMTFNVPATTYVFRTRAYVYNSKYQTLPRNAVLQLVSVNDVPVSGVQVVVCAGYELEEVNNKKDEVLRNEYEQTLKETR
jgi:hypothetical protein